MNRPNITEGEWKYVRDVFKFRILLDSDELFEEVAIVDCGLVTAENSQMEPYAQAISAVPEMLDALIEQEDIMQSLRNGYEVDNDRLQEAWKQVYFALKKAGCSE